MRRARNLVFLLGLSPLLSGCLMIAADMAIGTVGTAVGAAGTVGGAAVGAVIPGGDDDDDDD